MLNNTSKIKYAEDLVDEIHKILCHNEQYIKKTNELITSDTQEMIGFDFDFVKEYLNKYVHNHRQEIDSNLKGKGNVLIILSYNEPIIMSIIPIMNALIAGNMVFVKPSSRCKDFFKFIWTQKSLAFLLKDKLSIIEVSDNSELESHIKNMHSTYFFGSENVAKNIYQVCAKHFVEFIPEIETADPKVYYINNPAEKEIFEDCLETLKSSYSHAGQMCERISGVYVHESSYELYKTKIVEAYHHLITSGELNTILRKDFKYNQDIVGHILRQVQDSGPSNILGTIGKDPVVVFDPAKGGEFIRNGYFYPILWVSSFKNESEIIKLLQARKYFLGINLKIDNRLIVANIINETRFTRFTTLSGHEKVSPNEGWGGNWPSGSGGYKSWFEHFSIRYSVL